jgi:hypothetical protein
MFVEGRHNAEAHNSGTDLKLHGKNGQWFVVDAGAETTFTTRMARVATAREDYFAVLNRRIVG